MKTPGGNLTCIHTETSMPFGILKFVTIKGNTQETPLSCFVKLSKIKLENHQIFKQFDIFLFETVEWNDMTTEKRKIGMTQKENTEKYYSKISWKRSDFILRKLHEDI